MNIIWVSDSDKKGHLRDYELSTVVVAGLLVWVYKTLSIFPTQPSRRLTSSGLKRENIPSAGVAGITVSMPEVRGEWADTSKSKKGNNSLYNHSLQLKHTRKKNKTKKSQDGCHMKPLNTKAFLVLCQQWMLVVCVFPPLLKTVKTKDYIISKVVLSYFRLAACKFYSSWVCH